jgi:hypothetical protein
MNNLIFQLSQILSKHSWVIFLVMFVAAGFFFVIEPPKRRCDTLIDAFQGKHSAWLASPSSRVGGRSSQLQKQLVNCKQANSPGGCLDLFMSYRFFLDDLSPLRLECSEALAQRMNFKSLYEQLISLLVQIAWGEGVPGEEQMAAPSALARGFSALELNQVPRRPLAWLEPADLALFCRLTGEYSEVWGKDELTRFTQIVLQTLPGDLPVIEAGKCLNCETRRNALQTLPLDRARSRSLFAIPCHQLR